MTWLCHTTEIAGSGPIRRTGLIAHGILGSRRGWRSFARRLAASIPDWSWITVDLRNHGESSGAPPPHTLQACADDLAAVMTSHGRVADAVIGHSYGGKVVLELARRRPLAGAQVWVLDSPPGSTATGQVERVVETLRGVPIPAASRDDVIEHLKRAGFTTQLANWIATSLDRGGDGQLRWCFDLNAVSEMLRSYRATDLAPVALDPPGGATVHLVRAEQSDRWSAADLALLERPELEGCVHALPNAGHWLHIDAPEALHTLLLRFLQ